jgi:septal ring factor EnvC (AmiA/AmiB activator)
LEETAKGLAEENLVLKERIKKLVAMGVSVDAGGVAVGDGLVEETAQVAAQEETTGKRSTPVVISDAMVDSQPDMAMTASSTVELPPPILRTGNKSSLQMEMEAHFRQQIDELRTVLQEKREQLGSRVDEPTEDAENFETEHRQIQDTNNRLQQEIRILYDAVSRVRAEQARAKNINEQLRTRVREAEAQLLVKEGVARTGVDAGFRIDESRSDVQRAFKDLKRHLGLLIGVSLLLSTSVYC